MLEVECEISEHIDSELYFEEDSIDDFVEKLDGMQGINFVHPAYRTFVGAKSCSLL